MWISILEATSRSKIVAFKDERIHTWLLSKEWLFSEVFKTSNGSALPSIANVMLTMWNEFGFKNWRECRGRYTAQILMSTGRLKSVIWPRWIFGQRRRTNLKNPKCYVQVAFKVIIFFFQLKSIKLKGSKYTAIILTEFEKVTNELKIGVLL